MVVKLKRLGPKYELFNSKLAKKTPTPDHEN